eukprot:CAMPEP_0172368588 /NCGR_PEP_ID=MMETSP1060-20121228/28094_1 /TAXON_ID=37318 /ORGANISM="Pseudo-nitzschia pungens, Strain cf. cingulata" /LENGTH=407 /DNA_ID=CAMNT_0013093229 /DNA_START=292 /DNA_END=1515 /DNA_ORIENTATION=-
MPIRGGTIINIAGTTPVDDPEYRYRMPAIYGKIEGAGNGIKTVLPNISDVALSLHRAPGEVNKFFGCELGAQTTYNEDTDRAVVNGAHPDDALQKLIHKYIEGFVLCPNCGLPETKYSIKSGCIWHRCAACGAKEMVDMNHKLTNYILAQDKKARKEKGKKKKDDGKKAKEDSDEGGKKKKKDKKEKKSKKDKKGKKDKESPEDAGDEEKNYLKEAIFGKKENGDFGVDSEDDEVASEAGVDDEGAMELAIEGTRKYLAENPDASASDIAEVVANQQMASALKAHDKIKIFVRAAITPQFFKNKEIEKYAPVISKIVNGNKIIERHLIGSLELLSVEKPKNFPVMLKQLYDEDALEEGTIIEWSEDGRSEYTVETVNEEARATLRSEAEPLVVWLQEADSDSDSDEE